MRARTEREEKSRKGKLDGRRKERISRKVKERPVREDGVGEEWRKMREKIREALEGVGEEKRVKKEWLRNVEIARRE